MSLECFKTGIRNPHATKTVTISCLARNVFTIAPLTTKWLDYDINAWLSGSISTSRARDRRDFLRMLHRDKIRIMQTPIPILMDEDDEPQMLAIEAGAVVPVDPCIGPGS
jgi:hypothetical protein